MGRTDGSDRRVTTSPVDDSGAGILHVDMDAFFASVELLDHPELVGKPAIVGHATGRSVVTSATYEARRRGVRSAMPVSQALRLCPDAVVLTPHMQKYREYSARVMQLFGEVTPVVEQVSIDEAFLDVSGARRLLGSPADIGATLRRRVREQTGLPCSVGIAGTKFVAKLASGRAKPDGLLVVPVAETLAFLHPLPVGALWGVGPSTEESLTRRGLRTVADIAATPLEVLQRWVGEAVGRKLHELSHGVDPRPVASASREKSVGHEVTFEHDVTDAAVLRRELLRLAGQTGERLRRAGLVGRTVSLKLRYGDFRTVTRSRTLAEHTDVGRRVYDEVAAVFDALWAPGDAIRLIGVRMEQLQPGGEGGLALWDPDEEWRDAERALDEVAARFGGGAIGPASLVRTRPRRVGDTSSIRSSGLLPPARDG
ncbi:DNA polymerase IV [Microbacterium sp. STN6]|uniref:DNA polymerase IV n=1 Tax=Microbacterium sp. STN6 TaxID=2995588 RepID=UPI00226084AD|nr:DNA polymerase IV [Microbacterium sp. STN6]MCX7522170.1 DNA polymerase IV [Microbacterium sp. STN6]